MSGNLVSYFTLLLLLLALLMSCGGVSGDAAETTSYTWRDKTDSDGTLSSLRGPSVVNLENGMVVVAEGHVRKSDGGAEITGVMSRIMENSGGETRTEISLTEDDVKNGTKILEGTPTEGETKTHNVTRPTTVVTENNIYMLLTKSSAEGKAAGKEGNSLLFVSGTLSKEGAEKQVTWSDTKVATLPSTRVSLTQLATSGGSGIAMEEHNRVAFPIQATNTNGENVLLVLHGSVKDNKWELSTEVDADGCSDPAIVEWEEGNKFLMITPCAKGSYDVYRSTENGNGWYYTDVPLTRVWGTSRTRSGSGVRSGFITTTIEKRKVLLVTLPVYSENGKGRLHLFLTDNAHVYDVGPVSPEGDDAAASNLLYTNDNKLTVVYEKNTNASTATSLVSVRLTEQLKQIKSVVKTWDEVDKSLKECTSDNRKPCSRGVSTERLVGFLSGTLTDNEWKDEYLCVNATVKGAEKTNKGLKFQGTGAGAEWPVGKLGQNQPYYFANNEFTLVATVTIHEEPTADSTYPLIGVKMNDTANTVLFGLSYSHDKKWVLVFNNEEKESESADTWEKDKEYQVALSMKGSELSVYIDGDQINEEEESDKNVLDALFSHNRISHFYIGGHGDYSNGAAASSSVTVTNVLLYNKELFAGDLKKLKSNKVIPSVENAGQEGDKSESAQETVQGTEEEEQSPGASPSLDKSSPNAPEKTVEKKSQNGGSTESQGAKQLSPLNGEVGAKQTASDTTTKEEEPQEQHEESPPPKNDTGKDNERLEEVSEVEGNTLREETDDETTPQQILPLDESEEEDDDNEEEPSSAADKEGTIIVKDAGHTNPNETTPSGLDNHDNASSRGSDEASTSGENNVSNADTPQRSTDERNEGTLEGIEPAPGAHREGNANPIAASSPSNNTSVDSKNVTDLVARLTNNDSAARGSLTRGLLLLFLGLRTVLSLC